MTTLATLALSLAALYAVVTFVNLTVFRVPPLPGRERGLPAVSVLIPARNEATNIGPALDAVLASEGVELEAIVLDDNSTDGTAEIAGRRAARDRRIRVVRGGDLPPGWNGKQHACWRLALEARAPVLVFVDADVRIAPEGLVRLVGHLERGHLDLVSGFPRQVTHTIAEKLVISQILVLLLGYLPFPLARAYRSSGFAAGCGQLMVVRRTAYEQAGGHSAIRTTMHDGILLPRLIRDSSGRTDIVDATPLAHCRMYRGWRELWAGFSKNATEGMARPLALPIWTVLLGGGHILPFLVAAAAAVQGSVEALELSAAALGLLLAARSAVAVLARQSPLSVLAHPVGVAIVLAIQWNAIAGARRGRQVSWRGRSYDAG